VERRAYWLNHTSGPIAYSLAPPKKRTDWTYNPDLDDCRCVICSKSIVSHLSSVPSSIDLIAYASSKPAVYGISADDRVGVISRWGPW
jgi:hypothetical protein